MCFWGGASLDLNYNNKIHLKLCVRDGILFPTLKTDTLYHTSITIPFKSKTKTSSFIELGVVAQALIPLAGTEGRLVYKASPGPARATW